MKSSIRTKFLGGFLFIAAIFGGAVLFAWEDVADVGRIIRQMYQGPIQAMDAGRSAQRDFYDLRRHYLAADTMPQQRWARRYTLLHDKVDAELDREIGLAPTVEIRGRAEQAKKILAQWHAALMTGQFMSRVKQIDGLADQVETLLEQNVAASQEIAGADVAAAADAISLGGREIAAAGAAALVLGLVVLLILSRSVVAPIERAVRVANRIAEGDFSGEINGMRRDETGQLLRALAVMQDSLVEQRRQLEAKKVELEVANAELDKLASTDKLTGLFNRRKLEEFAKLQLATINRYGGRLSAILLDVDHFKKINDTFGHQKGDEVLMHMAAILRKSIRETDFVARWGGEEFVILLPNTPLEGAVTIAEKCRETIASHIFPDVGHKTSSFGVCQLGDKEAFQSMMERADRALYAAKNAGRNTVTVS